MGASPVQPVRPFTDALSASARAARLGGHHILARYVRTADSGTPAVREVNAPIVAVEIVADGLAAARMGHGGGVRGGPGFAGSAADPVRGQTGRLSVAAARPGDPVPDGDPHGATAPGPGGVSAAVLRLRGGDVFVVPGAEVGRPEEEDVRVRVVPGTVRTDGIDFVAGVSW